MSARALTPGIFVAGALALAAAIATDARAAGAETAAGDGKNDGKVDSVVVFQDRARVTRTRAARCEHGKASAQFEHLPDALDTRTLRGETRDGGDCRASALGLKSWAVESWGGGQAEHGQHSTGPLAIPKNQTAGRW